MREFLKQFLSNPGTGAVRFQEWAERRRSRRGRAHLARGAGLAGEGRFSAAALAFSAMIELDPSNAEGHHGHGVCQLGLGKFEIARDSFLRARDRAPLRDDIRNRLGLALRGLSLLQETTESFKTALVLRPGSGEALNNLADVLQARDLEDAAFTGFARTLAVLPTTAGVHSNLAGAYRDAGRFSEADDSYDRALVLDPEHAITHFSRSLLALLRGDFEAGWDGFEWRNRAMGFIPSADYDASQWHGEDIENKSIYVHSEQGLGDVLQFVRYTRVTPEPEIPGVR